MPELPEVETVKQALKKTVLNKTIENVLVYYNGIIAKPDVETFKSKLKNQTILDVKRRGKWLIFELNDYYLVSHLRMEGKYYYKNKTDELSKHQHVIFNFGDTELRYNDTRKFGKMYLFDKEDLYKENPLKDLGLEPWDNNLTINYLKQKFKNKKLPIKTLLLDQNIIAGIGNIYDDEILFLSRVNPLKKGSELSDKELQLIIDNTKKVLEDAILLGGTTIKTYTSSEGTHGRFQEKLLVHTKKTCPNCLGQINKIKINGRGTYYCLKCQK